MSVTAPSADPPPPGDKPDPPAVRIVEPAPTAAEARPAAVPVSAPEAAPRPTPVPIPVSTPAVEPRRPEREASRLRRLVVVGGTLLGLFVVYQIVVYFVAYTDDAYVRSDLVAVASEVTGPILKVHVVDNQDVEKGDRLFTIDPVPFQLIVNQRQAEIDEQRALVKVSQEELSSSRAALAASTAAHIFAQQQQVRFADLAKNEYAPRADLDKANDDLRRTAAEMRISEFGIEKAQNGIVAHQAALNRALAEMATAQWALGKTQVVAPIDGTVTNLTVQPGDTANANVPIIGIVDAHAWRIMANYKEAYIRSFKVGDTAWVWLDSQPFQFHRARIQGIARGFSRETAQEKLLPYVAPTTDWIRLQRRVPVTITLVDPPPGFRLYMGTDARTVIFP